MKKIITAALLLMSLMVLGSEEEIKEIKQMQSELNKRIEIMEKKIKEKNVEAPAKEEVKNEESKGENVLPKEVAEALGVGNEDKIETNFGTIKIQK